MLKNWRCYHIPLCSTANTQLEEWYFFVLNVLSWNLYSPTTFDVLMFVFLNFKLTVVYLPWVFHNALDDFTTRIVLFCSSQPQRIATGSHINYRNGFVTCMSVPVPVPVPIPAPYRPLLHYSFTSAIFPAFCKFFKHFMF